MKHLFSTFCSVFVFCCLSANVQAQKIDTLALIREALQVYTNTNFWDTLKTKGLGGISEQVVFFTMQNMQQNAIKNAYVWDKDTWKFEFMDMDMCKMHKNYNLYKVIPVTISLEKNQTIHLFFNTTSKIEIAPVIYTKIDTLLNGSAREIEIPYCTNTTLSTIKAHCLPVSAYFRIIDLPTFFQNTKGIPIEMIPDAQFLYNIATKKYEIQPFERQSERQNWFANTCLIGVTRKRQKAYRDEVKRLGRRPCH